MIPVRKFLSNFNCQQATIRSLIFTMGLVLVLFSSFVPVKYPPAEGGKAAWLLPSTTGMEKLHVYKEAHDPNSDLHLSIRKQNKLKCVKKLTPNALAAERANSTEHVSYIPNSGFSTVERPAYYVFLFRYTLF